MKAILTFVLLTVLVAPAVADAGAEVTRILDNMLKDYDARVRPNYGGAPVDVNITMYIIGIHSFSARSMDMTFDLYFRQQWFDPRLVYVSSRIDKIVPSPSFANKLWRPDTFFANEKSASFHVATTPNTFIRLSPNGNIYQSMRLSLTVACPMNLANYPFDSQRCTLEIESYGSSMADIRYHFPKGKASVGIGNYLELPAFKIPNSNAIEKIETLSSGNYSRLIAEVEFMRVYGYNALTSFIPAALLVMLSWLPSWLPTGDAVARPLISVVSIIGLIVLWVHGNADIAPISYIKAFDYYFIWCLVLVVLAVIESIVVRAIRTRGNPAEKTVEDGKLAVSVGSRELNVGAGQIDNVARAGLPLLLVIFLVIYFACY